MDKVEVVYAPYNQPAICISVAWSKGMTVENVLEHARIAQQYPETIGMALGIFAKLVSLSTRVKAGDRIEIYRPLLRDPKDARRVRAKKNKL